MNCGTMTSRKRRPTNAVGFSRIFAGVPDLGLARLVGVLVLLARHLVTGGLLLFDLLFARDRVLGGLVEPVVRGLRERGPGGEEGRREADEGSGKKARPSGTWYAPSFSSGCRGPVRSSRAERVHEPARLESPHRVDNQKTLRKSDRGGQAHALPLRSGCIDIFILVSDDPPPGTRRADDRPRRARPLRQGALRRARRLRQRRRHPARDGAQARGAVTTARRARVL